MKKIIITSQVREREQEGEKNLSEILEGLQDLNCNPQVKIISKDFEFDFIFEGLENLITTENGLKVLSKLFTPVKSYFENRVVDFPLNGDSYLKSVSVKIEL